MDGSCSVGVDEWAHWDQAEAHIGTVSDCAVGSPLRHASTCECTCTWLLPRLGTSESWITAECPAAAGGLEEDAAGCLGSWAAADMRQ